MKVATFVRFLLRQCLLELSAAYFRSGSTISVGGFRSGGRVKVSPNWVKPGTKPPWDRKNWPSSTPMKRSSRSAFPVGSWLNEAVVSSIQRPSSVRIH